MNFPILLPNIFNHPYSSKQIFDFITASQKSNNYEVSHIIIQKISSKKNLNFLE